MNPAYAYFMSGIDKPQTWLSKAYKKGTMKNFYMGILLL